MMGKYLQESILLNETFESDYINLTTSFNIKKIGKTSFAKFFTILHIQASLLKALLRKKVSALAMIKPIIKKAREK